MSCVAGAHSSAEEELDNASDQVFLDDDASSTAAWELSKENVLPLRTGRQHKRLNEAVARDSLSQDIVSRDERHSFESELRACSLDKNDEENVKEPSSEIEKTKDASKSPEEPSNSATSSQPRLHRLLDVWHRYVLWTEQNYPSGKELAEILQRSLQAFPEATGEMASVADDVNYVDLWLKLANQREEPGDLFQVPD